MPKARPWYKRSGADFVMATLSFPSSDHKWAYSAIVDMLNERDRPLADDPAFICGFTGLSRKRWTPVRQWLLDHGYLVKPTGDTLSNPRFEREHAARAQYREQQAELGREGAQARWGQAELDLDQQAAGASDSNDLAMGDPIGPRVRARPARARARSGGLSGDNREIIGGLSRDKSALLDRASSNSNDLPIGDPTPRVRAKRQESREESHPIPTQSDVPVRAPAREDAGQSGRVESVPPDDLDALLAQVLAASGFRPHDAAARARARTQVAEWVQMGISFDAIVLPTIRAMIARSDEPTRTLGRFKREVEHEHARLSAHKANGSVYRAPAAPILDPPDEDVTFRPIREALLESLGAEAYSSVLNSITFEDAGRCQGDKHPLRIRGPDYMINLLHESRWRSRLMAAAKPHGFTDLWK